MRIFSGITLDGILMATLWAILLGIVAFGLWILLWGVQMVSNPQIVPTQTPWIIVVTTTPFDVR